MNSNSLDLLSSVCNDANYYTQQAASLSNTSPTQTPTIICNRNDLLSCSSTITGTTDSFNLLSASTTRDTPATSTTAAASSPHHVFQLG